MDPVERIRKALGPDDRAAFERALASLANRVEQITTLQESAEASLTLRAHRGRGWRFNVRRDEEFAA